MDDRELDRRLTNIESMLLKILENQGTTINENGDFVSTKQ